MKHVQPSQVPEQDAAGPIFEGSVSRQTLVGPDDSHDHNMAIVNFSAGARNKFHRHTRDQVLIVTKGVGIVATKDEEVEAHLGDVFLIPAGETHWHGATPTTEFAHITLTPAGTTTEIAE